MKMRSPYQRILLGSILVLLSVVFYVLHFIIFRDAHHIFIYLLSDVAFVFTEVLLVTLIIHQVLSEREKRATLKKLNMVIGAFFSEAGMPLLKYFWAFDAEAESFGRHLNVDNEWSPEHFVQIQKVLRSHDYDIHCDAGDSKTLQDFLAGR